MNIGINLIALPAETGGGAFRYIQQMFKAMGEYDLQKIHFIIYKQQQISKEYLGIPSVLDVEYVDVPMLGSGLKRIVFEQTLFYKYLKRSDVLYSYCTSMPLFAKCRKVFTLHDIYYLTTKQRYSWSQRNYLKWITKIYCALCDTIITVSQFSYNEIKKYIGVPDEKLALTYNFIIPDKNSGIVKPKQMSDVIGRPIDLSKPFFFYIGDLQPGKNIKGMIDGFAKYSKGRTDIQLIVAGKSSPYGNQMMEYISSTDNIYYLGYISRNDVSWFQANCLATVLLSFCEGFGIPPIEGFGYNKPALTSNTTSLPEVVGNAGVKVNPYSIDAIADGFKSLEIHTQSYSSHIPEQLGKFNYKVSVEKFMDVLGITY